MTHPFNLYMKNFITYIDSKDDIDDDEYLHEVDYIMSRLYSTGTLPKPKHEVIL